MKSLLLWSTGAIWGVTTSCLAGGPQVFTEEAAARGVNYVIDTALIPLYGRGAAFADLDNDGDPDLVLLGAGDDRVGIFENDGTGHFTDRSDDAGIPTRAGQSGVAAADYDRDGDLDVYITTYNTANLLLRNDGNFQFTDVAADLGVDDPGSGGQGASWGDFDLDGWLDLSVSNFSIEPLTNPNRLFRNLGGAGFEDVAGPLGVDDDSRTFQTVFFDYDRDGDLDMYVANDRANDGCDAFQNYLFENEGGVFTDVTYERNAQGCVDSMCIAVGDFDGNRRLDLYVTNLPIGNILLAGQTDNTFVDISPQAGTMSDQWGWGSWFFDADLDGLEDLYTVNTTAPNHLYLNSPTWPCTDVAPAMGLDDPGVSYCCTVADIDLDGDVDILLTNHNAPVQLLVNHAPADRHWSRLTVRGRDANRDGIGALVETRTGSTWRIRKVIAGSGLKSQGELPLHVGLGDADLMDEVVITWNGGATRTLTNLPADQAWTIYPDERLGDGDDDGDVDLADFVQFAACASGPVTPGCEMMDLDGDSTVDLDDFTLFMTRYEGRLEDCNDNGEADVIDIMNGTSADENQDGRPDECDVTVGDLDGNGSVNAADLAMLLDVWGTSDAQADFDGDGVVGPFDLAVLLDHWG